MNGEAKIRYIESLKNIADGFTKILSRDLFIIFKERLGIIKLETIQEVIIEIKEITKPPQTDFTGQEGVSKSKKRVRFSDQQSQ